MAEVEEDRGTEVDRVVSWRFEMLLNAGLGPVLAEQIARRVELDYRIAVRLAGQQVPQNLIGRIVL